MGGSHTQVTGPDFSAGIPSHSLPKGKRILGHVGETAVLLVNENGQIYAINALCSHYGANLNDGIVADGTIRCPWHHACFDLKTGEATKAPALSPVATWQTEIQNGTIYVRGQCAPGKVKAQGLNKEHFLVIGSGAAGHAAAEYLRRLGFDGRLTMISADTDYPYDRPNLSKDYLAGNAPQEWMPLRSPEFYQEQKIDVMLNTEVVKLDVRGKSVEFADGKKLNFTKCLIATGGSPKVPPIPGADLPHVHVLRSFTQARALIQTMEHAKKAAIVGAGFIGLEAAAAMKARGLEVTLVAPDEVPLARVVGPEVGAWIRSVHEKNGVRLRLQQGVKKIEAGHISLDSGQEIPADVVLLATGISPNLSLAEAAGLKCENGILVNELLETSAKDVFAAGDAARWPGRDGKSYRIEHWAVAQRLGQTAARNMLGQNKKFADVPFFWSQQFDVTLNYIGSAPSWTKSKVYGSLEERNCAVAYFNGDKVEAVLTVGRDEQSLRMEHAMELGDQKQLLSILES